MIADRIGAKPVLVGTFRPGPGGGRLSVHQGHAVGSCTALSVIFGLAYGGVMPLYAVLVRDYFGQRIMGTTFGAVAMFASLGMALGPWAGGFAFDTYGSYAWLYIGSFAYRTRRRRHCADLPAGAFPTDAAPARPEARLRRGRRRPTMTYEIADTDVLLVVDVQNDFCPGGALAVAAGHDVVAAINRRRAGLRGAGADPGLAPARAPLLRRQPSRCRPLLDHRDGLRPAGALAGALRAGHAGRRFPPRARDRRRRPHSAQGLPHRESTAIPPSSRTIAPPRPASPATSAARNRPTSGWPGSPPISASLYSALDAAAAGFAVTLLEDACRPIDLDGSLAATRQAFAHLAIPCVAAQTII